jgi:hypothetical protein
MADHNHRNAHPEIAPVTDPQETLPTVAKSENQNGP